jgi:hypothetical protein
MHYIIKIYLIFLDLRPRGNAVVLNEDMDRKRYRGKLSPSGFLRTSVIDMASEITRH